MFYNVLLLTNGTISYTLARKFKESQQNYKLFVFAESGSLFIDYDNVQIVNQSEIINIAKFIQDNEINFVIVFNEGFSKSGLYNYIKYDLKIPAVGITRYWAQLETSKRFAKEFMIKNNIPTPKFSVISNLDDLKRVMGIFSLPLVIKMDGLAHGFGSFICNNESDCFNLAKKILKNNHFFIVEKFIQGEEVTLHTIWDGNTLVPLEPVRDYKKSKNNNEGINTGSLGCYLPVNLTVEERKLLDLYIKRLEDVFLEKKPNFTGIFASDLIFTQNEVYNLEFNMRPCTPEFEVFAEHINNDLLELLYNIALGNCKNLKFDYKQGITGCVNLVHKDYLKYPKRVCIKKVKLPPSLFSNDCKIIVNKNLITKDKNIAKISVLSRFISLINNDKENPFPLIYDYVSEIKDKNIYFRTDIGQ